MSLALLTLLWAACASPAEPSPKPDEDAAFGDAIEVVAGEPVFRSDLVELTARGVPEREALARLRVYSLLAASARARPDLVHPRERELARRRAAVQLYLRDLRRTAEPPTEAELRARFEASGDPRVFEEVRDELSEIVTMERTFARIVERVTAGEEAVSPVLTPEALPALDALDFGEAS